MTLLPPPPRKQPRSVSPEVTERLRKLKRPRQTIEPYDPRDYPDPGHFLSSSDSDLPRLSEAAWKKIKQSLIDYLNSPECKASQKYIEDVKRKGYERIFARDGQPTATDTISEVRVQERRRLNAKLHEIRKERFHLVQEQSATIELADALVRERQRLDSKLGEIRQKLEQLEQEANAAAMALRSI